MISGYLVAGLSTFFVVVSIGIAEESGLIAAVSNGALCIDGVAVESPAASSVVVLSVHEAIRAEIAIIDKNFFIVDIILG